LYEDGGNIHDDNNRGDSNHDDDNIRGDNIHDGNDDTAYASEQKSWLIKQRMRSALIEII
jgi:hypothetical protein